MLHNAVIPPYRYTIVWSPQCKSMEKGNKQRREASFSEFLLHKMFRLVGRLVIHMNVGPFNVRQTLQLHLEFFRNIVRGHQRCVWIHDDVHFDNKSGTSSI